MTAINAPATYSPTNSVPTNDNTASRSTPARPRRNDTTTHTKAGTTAASVPATQHPSATARHPMSHAMPPSTSAATVTTTKAGSNSDRNPGHHGRAVDLDSEPVTAHPCCRRHTDRSVPRSGDDRAVPLPWFAP